MCMIVYGLKTCDSCRKALKSLPDARLADIRAEPVPAAVLARAIETFGARLINTRSTTWRGLDAAARALPPADLIAANPAVMKRPLIDAGGTLYLGWDDAVRRALTGAPD